MKYIIQDFNRTHILKTNGISIVSSRKKLIALLLTILLIFIAIGITVIMYLSNVKLKKTDYYILSLGSETSLDSLDELSKTIIDGGGGGYIINDGEFKVTAAVYKSKADAETVKIRMSERFNLTQIIDINIKAAKIKKLDRKSNKEIKNILQYPIELFDYLLEENIKLDSQKITESGLMLLLDDKANKIDKNIDSIKDLLKIYNDSFALIKAFEFYNLLLIDFKEMLLDIESINMLTQKLKYFCCKQICMYRDLREEIKI